MSIKFSLCNNADLSCRVKVPHNGFPAALIAHVKRIKTNLLNGQNQSVHSMQHFINAFLVTCHSFQLWSKDVVELH